VTWLGRGAQNLATLEKPDFSALGFKKVPGYDRRHRSTMTKAIDFDLKKLQARDRAERAEEAIRRYHATISNLKMFVPTTLWPFNVQDVLENCLSALEKGKRLNSRHRLLIDLLPEPPDETICAAVAVVIIRFQGGGATPLG